jgi:hypothetical protein
MDKVEAKQLLAQRLPNTLLNSTKAINKLLNVLAYLLLTIIQAAAFINNNDIAVSRYVALIRNTGTKAELFSKHFKDPNQYQEIDSTIAKTWHISFNQIRRQDKLAAEYLSFIACINHINIPQSLLPPRGSEVQQA